MPTSPLLVTVAVIPSTTDVPEILSTCNPVLVVDGVVVATVVLPLDNIAGQPALTELIVMVVRPELIKGEVIKVPVPPLIVNVALLGPLVLAPVRE